MAEVPNFKDKKPDMRGAHDAANKRRAMAKKMIEHVDKTGKVDYDQLCAYMLKIALQRSLSPNAQVRAAGERMITVIFNRTPNPKSPSRNDIRNPVTGARRKANQADGSTGGVREAEIEATKALDEQEDPPTEDNDAESDDGEIDDDQFDG